MSLPNQRVCVIGLGYIGLPTASLLATKGFAVTGVDVNRLVVERLNEGEVTIQEPSLDILVKSAVQSGNLKASLKPCEADIFILAVPTPFLADRSPDLSYVQAATESVTPFLGSNNLVILESTSPIGTTEKISEWVFAARPELRGKVYFSYCPERVLPGRILRELVENDRIVGGINKESCERAASFYGQFVSGEIFRTDCKTAEMSKLTENIFRDVNIALANELSLICEKSGIDVWELIQLANRHPRVKILSPGPGVGGHCIAVDPWFVVSAFPEESRLIRAAREVNDAKPHHVIRQVKEKLKGILNPSVACLGLAYKPDIDDLRESPAVEIVSALARDANLTLKVAEPFVNVLPPELREKKNVSLCDTKSAISQADLILLLVDHREFKSIDSKSLIGKIIIDTRGVWGRVAPNSPQ